MSQYRSTIQKRLIVLIVCAVLSLTAVILGTMLAGIAETPDSTFTDGMSRGFPVGLFTAFFGLLVFQIVQCVRGLRREAVLKKMYITEHDERTRTIRHSALEMSFFFMAGVLVVGVTISSFYNNTVCFTLTAVLMAHAVTGAVLKLFFSLKY